MAISKESKGLGMPWEKDPGYAQGLKVGDTIYISGQVSHDDQGNILGIGDMELQMRTAYANVKKVLAQYGATMDNVVDETLFVTDMDTAFPVLGKVRREVYSDTTVVANTIVQIQRLAFTDLMIEIRCIANI